MLNKTAQLTMNRRVSDKPKKTVHIGSVFDRIVSAVLLLVCVPIFILNVIIAKVMSKPVFRKIQLKDCLSRSIQHFEFTSGMLKRGPILWVLFTRKISFCGMPLKLTLSKIQKSQLKRYHHVLPGLYDCASLHQSSGLILDDPVKLLKHQFTHTLTGYISLLLRGVISQLIYKNQSEKLATPAHFSLFGLKINNLSMKQAVKWVVQKNKAGEQCKIGCFINVNSVNLSVKHRQLVQDVNRADHCFADGSGLRLAAKNIGIKIKENVNGTDMLPHLCEAAVDKDMSIYLLGSQEGVALQTATNLRKQYPNLRIVGTQHGYFTQEQTLQVIDKINQSKADILLLAMGSPNQEAWLNQYAPYLQCRTALAVGGLFDFYSGKIPRAPMWMRELGLEWVWRLIQEPKGKFNRYVIGNPLFLFRTFVLNQAKRGL